MLRGAGSYSRILPADSLKRYRKPLEHMEDYNENQFVQANVNSVIDELTIELTVWVSRGIGFDLISINKSGYKDFYEAINVLKGRMISVYEEWNYTELTKNDWLRIYRKNIVGGKIIEMDLDIFKEKYNQLINDMNESQEEIQKISSRRRRILGMRPYNLTDTKYHFGTQFDIVEEKIQNVNPLEIENIITSYKHRTILSEDYYFDDAQKYYGLFLTFSS